MSKYVGEFEELARLYIKRDGLESLLGCLRSSDFYVAPASTRFHGAEEFGLVVHSMGVLNRLMNNPLALQYSNETLAIVALFHDICKIGFYKTEMRNAKNEQGKWIQVPYYTVNDLFPIGHGSKSVIMLMEHFKLTPDEIMAINWHMGGFVSKDEYMSLSSAMDICPLIIHLNYADMCASYLDKV